MSDYPEDSIQYLAGSWWEPSDTSTLCRGTLIVAHSQFFSQIPVEIYPERISPEDHGSAVLKARPLRADSRRTPEQDLPVAGLPRLEDADAWAAYRVKKRPCLVLGCVENESIEKHLMAGMPKHHTHEFVMVAPYYGVKPTGRAGYNVPFCDCIRHAKFSRYFWDVLPGSSGCESVLRLDQAQPLGLHYQSYQHTGSRIGEKAMQLMDEWLSWYLFGIDGDNIAAFRDLWK